MVSPKWSIVETTQGYAIWPSPELLKCVKCGGKMVLHDFAARKSSNIYHCDVHLKCLECSYWETYGVPLSEEEYKILSSSPLNFRIALREELIPILPESEAKIVAERLKKMGYW